MNTDLSNIRQRGLDALTRELGAAGAVLFLRQFENGYGDYTKERETLLKDVSIDDIASSIAERKKLRVQR
jgi:hypothetical protein